MKIHHNTLKKAKVHDLTISAQPGGDFVVLNPIGDELARASDPRDALDLAIKSLAPVKVPKARVKLEKKSKRKADKFKCEGCGSTWKEGDGDGGFICSDCGEPVEDDGGEGASIIKKKYKTRYRPFKMTCGDEMTKLIRAAVCVKLKVKIGSKMKNKMRIDKDKLKALARVNDCWDPAYGKLNVGQQRMNVGNRLRARVRKGLEIKWS